MSYTEKWKSLSDVQLFETPWTVQYMEVSWLEYWSGKPFPSPGDLLNPGIKSRSSSLQVDSLPAEPQVKPRNTEAGSLPLLQQIFLTQELNWGLLHCRQILYQLSYQGSLSYTERHSIEGKSRRGWQRMRRLDGIINTMDMSLRKLQERVKEREAWRAAARGVAKRLIWLSDCMTTKAYHIWEAASRLNEWTNAETGDCLGLMITRVLMFASPLGFPDNSVAKQSACNAGHPSSIPGSGRSTGEGIGYPL